MQLARHAGVTVIGTATPAHHDALRALGATPVDYRAADAYAQIRRLAPAGVDAVFDHVGGQGLVASYRLLRRGGTLVSYGTAVSKDVEGNSQLPMLKLLRPAGGVERPAQRPPRALLQLLGRPPGAPTASTPAQREAFTAVTALLSDGSLTPEIAARFPLSQAASALRLAEAGGFTGKVVLLATP